MGDEGEYSEALSVTLVVTAASVPSVMMPAPSAPTVMMAASAAMPVSMTVPTAALDLDHGAVLRVQRSHAQSGGSGNGHCK